MNDLLKLTDGTTIEIEDGARLDLIIHISENEADALNVCKAITPANVQHVEFMKQNAAEPYGVYDDIVLKATPTRSINEDGTITVIISLREKTDIEKRLDALDESQETQNEAIDAILMG